MMPRFFKGYEKKRSVKAVRRILRRYDKSVGNANVRFVKRLLRQLLRKLDGVNVTFAYFTRQKYREQLSNLESKGRWKTRGGRDQDRWRKRQQRVNRVGDWYRRIRPFKVQRTYEVTSEVVENCFVKAMYESRTLGDNPDCDFVRGGE